MIGIGVLALLGYTILFVLLLALTSGVAYSAYVYMQHRKYAHIPSVKRANFFMGHYPTIKDYMKKHECPLAEVLYEWYKELGLVYCVHVLHNTFVVCLDSKVVKMVMTNSKHTKSHVDYDGFQAIFGSRFAGRSLVNETDHSRWSQRRALFNPAFHRQYLKGLMDIFNDSADRLVQDLMKRADGQTVVTMRDKFNSITLDVIGKVGFGLDLNAMEDPSCPFPVAATKVLQGLQKSLLVPWYSYIPSAHARNFRKEVKEACHLIREIGRDCILSRIEAKARGDATPQDILTYLLDASKELQGDQNFGLEEMIDEFVTFFVAGQETTGNHLSFTLQQICRYPEVLKKLLIEIEEVLGDKPFVDYSDLPKLEYLMLVMKESMRQFPPVSGSTRSLAHEIECCGYTIPKGTRLRVNHFIMGKMEKYFDDPEEFRPERFQVSDETPRHLYAYFPFSLGQRTCIGQSMAMMETRVILAKLLRRFTFDLVPGQKFGIKQELTNKPVDGCKTYITLRE
ncbi:cholesterol 24-hydroxylase isoform X1 [Strongylocentrotus purpuratus]|uniref:Cholesterol 24-hydroxylase n=1 Tax=Strongylocentrotus purpuratus TaxID=7668 RepID=A0A7M7RGU6_STRPU|nr:cholesterol 24-hydroxylase isoform X1 [Strongylocentrotus purpuratus]|eukprot:XP_792255.3 PREDICTED: cholesterol 24-hydroxylase isoform X1 [Strongylocentrotus purpuratus]